MVAARTPEPGIIGKISELAADRTLTY